jgi:hypothetical protein
MPLPEPAARERSVELSVGRAGKEGSWSEASERARLGHCSAHGASRAAHLAVHHLRGRFLNTHPLPGVGRQERHDLLLRSWSSILRSTGARSAEERIVDSQACTR